MKIDSISRSAFVNRTSFDPVEQPLRCCLCPHCCVGKLVMKSPVRMQSQLHVGDLSGWHCSCRCDLHTYGGYNQFLPTSRVKKVSSTMELHGKILCDRVFLYRTEVEGRYRCTPLCVHHETLPNMRQEPKAILNASPQFVAGCEDAADSPVFATEQELK